MIAESARLVGLGTAVPPHVIPQSDAKILVGRILGIEDDSERARILAVFDHGAIRTRRACMPLAWYGEHHDFAERNALYVEHTQALGRAAIEIALDRAALRPADVDHFVFVSSTGIATPSIDARLAVSLGFRPDVVRTPVWGLGCAGGAAGLARARVLASSAPGTCVLVLAIELCSLAFQSHDRSTRNVVASALFADGAAAAVVRSGPSRSSEAGPALELIAAGSTLWPDTLDVMGWDVDGDGLHVVFSRDIPAFVRERLRPSVEGFLNGAGIGLRDVAHFVAHPGGAKVLEAFQDALGRAPEELDDARTVLRDYGNMSSPTCLFVLERGVEAGSIAAGEIALLAALGPGFAAEYVLMRGAGP